MKFTSKDLKTRYPGKYDDWVFAKNQRGEWVGFYKKENSFGVIGAKKVGKKQVPVLLPRKALILTDTG